MKRLICLLTALNLLVSPVMAESIDESFEGTQTLTDTEQHTADNFVHTGLIQNTIDKECEKLEHGCGDDSVAAGQVLGGQVGGAVEEMLPKMYGMMGMMSMMGGGIGKIQMKGKAGDTDLNKKGNKEKQDLCVMIPTVGEMVVTTVQGLASQNAAQGLEQSEEKQKEALYATARIHEARAKTATTQAVVFGSTVACYGAYIAAGAVVDTGMVVKMAVAGGIATIYGIKASKHKNYAELIRGVADKLPGKGECNPYTATNCFCDEKSSEQIFPPEYAKVCIPAELGTRDPKTNPQPCFTMGQNGKPVPDNTCECKKTNSCYNNKLRLMASNFGVGGIMMDEAMNAMDLINSGEFDPAKMNMQSARLTAIAKKVNDKLPVGKVTSPNLNATQKKFADDLSKMTGMPANIAGNVAAANGFMPDSLKGGAAPALSAAVASASPRGEKLPGAHYEQSGRRGTTRKKSSDSFDNPFAKFGKGGAAKANSAVTIETFEERAMREAEITKDKSTPIFDIISSRYRRSAWTKVDMKKLEDEVVAEPVQE